MKMNKMLLAVGVLMSGVVVSNHTSLTSAAVMEEQFGVGIEEQFGIEEQMALEWMTEKLDKPARDDYGVVLGAFPVNYIPKDELYNIYAESPIKTVGEADGMIGPAKATPRYLDETVLIPLQVSKEEIEKIKENQDDPVTLWDTPSEYESWILDYDKVFNLEKYVGLVTGDPTDPTTGPTDPTPDDDDDDGTDGGTGGGTDGNGGGYAGGGKDEYADGGTDGGSDGGTECSYCDFTDEEAGEVPPSDGGTDGGTN